MRGSLLLLLGLVFAAPGMAEECKHHVSSLAADGVGTGTAANPWSLYDAGEETTPTGAVDAGHVVCLHSDGPYSQGIHTRGGGSAGAGRIVFRNVPGMPLPTLVTEGGGQCVNLTQGDWIRVTGIHCTGLDTSLPDPTIGPHLADNGARIISSHNVLEDSIFDHLNKTGIYVGVGTYNVIRNNIVRYIGWWGCNKLVESCGSGDGLAVDGADYTLVESNLVEYATHTTLSLKLHSYVVARDNVVRNPWAGTRTGVPDPGPLNNGPKAEGMVTGGVGSHNVFERNLLRDMGIETVTGIEQSNHALLIHGPRNVIRHNVFVHNQVGGMKTQSDSGDTGGNSIYGNVMHDNGLHGVTITEINNPGSVSRQHVYVNNIISHNGRRVAVQMGSTSALGTATVQVRFNLQPPDFVAGTPGDTTFSHNDIVHGACVPVGGDCTEPYTTALDQLAISVALNPTDEERTLADADASYPLFFGNVQDATEFVDEAGGDYATASGPAGAALTSTISCVGSQVTVDDPDFFSAGITDPDSGEVWAEGDRLRIGNEFRDIFAINYDTGLLSTLPIDCGAGEDVNLAYPGAAPPIGFQDTDADGIIDPADNCPVDANPDQLDDNANLVGDACEFDSLSFFGTAEGGSISFTIWWITLVVPTSAGESLETVAVNVAAAINADPILSLLLVSATVDGHVVTLSYPATRIAISDPGITTAPAVPAFSAPALFALSLMLCAAGVLAMGPRRWAGSASH